MAEVQLTIDLVDSATRVTELNRLVNELPPTNYALLRALTAHLILIVQNSASNKMTLRNIGIVFSPTLGIPAGIFSELVSHFGPIFDAQPLALGNGTISEEDEPTEGVKKRNSILYEQGGADAMLGLGGRTLDTGEFRSRELADEQSKICLRMPRGPPNRYLHLATRGPRPTTT